MNNELKQIIERLDKIEKEIADIKYSYLLRKDFHKFYQAEQKVESKRLAAINIEMALGDGHLPSNLDL